MPTTIPETNRFYTDPEGNLFYFRRDRDTFIQDYCGGEARYSQEDLDGFSSTEMRSWRLVPQPELERILETHKSKAAWMERLMR